MRFLLLTLGGIIDSEQTSFAGDLIGKDHETAPVSQALCTLIGLFKTNAPGAKGAPHELEYHALQKLGSPTVESAHNKWVADVASREGDKYDRIIVTLPSDYAQSFAHSLSRRFLLPPRCPVVTTGAEGPAGDDVAFNAINNLQMAAFDMPGLLPGFYYTAGNKLRSASLNCALYKPRRDPRSLIRHSHDLAAIACSAPKPG